MPRETIAGSALRPAGIPCVPSAYILENEPLERILFNRHLTGLPFAQACEAASAHFFRHFADDIAPLHDGIAEYMLLTKGMYYWLHHAYATVFNRNLQANFAVTKRVVTPSGAMTIQVPYLSADVPSPALVIGDTVASGQTICAALNAYLDEWPLKRVFIFSIAGSRVGATLIQEFCDRRGIALTVAFGLAAFGLAENGFDLSFLHPETICDSRYVEKARAVFSGRPVSSAGWDFASQCQATNKYLMLCSLEEQAWDLRGAGVFPALTCDFRPQLVQKEYSAFESFRRNNMP